MATRDRLEFVLQSIRYFQRQKYPNRELIILHDGSDNWSDRLPADDTIRYLKLPATMSIGAKRNRGCELARGAFIAHWDDDDWYAPNRLSMQLAPLIQGNAEITALPAGLFFDLSNWKFWRCNDALHRRLFVENVHGGTLVYKRTCWEGLSRYPDVSLAEDAYFLRQAVQRGARLRRLPNGDSFIYLRHVGNAWAFECGKHLDPQGWTVVPEPTLPPEDRAFYAARSAKASRPLVTKTNALASGDKPLVSCIMPTANRRFLVPRAVRYFLAQDYPNRELIVVDDGEDPVADLMPKDSRVRYCRVAQRQTIGSKRNLACEMAEGQFIAHWDDDDWMASWRLTYQLSALANAKESTVCGLSRILYYQPAAQHAWLYVYPEGQRRWLAGNTLCYRKSLWSHYPFSNLNEGEDTRFIWSVPQSSILPLPDHTFYVATVHEKNSSPKRTREPRWLPQSVNEINALLGSDSDFYQSWPMGKNLAMA
jgi:O-antigen biosynthesis protein